MEWKLTREPLASLSADAIVVFHFQKRESLLGVTREIDEALGFRISNLISLGEITGKFGEIHSSQLGENSVRSCLCRRFGQRGQTGFAGV